MALRLVVFDVVYVEGRCIDGVGCVFKVLRTLIWVDITRSECQVFLMAMVVCLRCCGHLL